MALKLMIHRPVKTEIGDGDEHPVLMSGPAFSAAHDGPIAVTWPR